MFENIMVCLDGSKLAEQALPHAVEKVACHQGRLILLQVLPEPVVASPGVPGAVPKSAILDTMLQEDKAALAEAKAYLEGIASPLRRKGVHVSVLTASGNTGPAILSTAGERKVNLIVMTTHGRSGLGRALFGSVADYIIRESGLPTLVVKPRERQTAVQAHIKKILVCLDGSRLAEQILPFAADDALSCQSKLVLFQTISASAAIPAIVEPVAAYTAEAIEQEMARLEHEAKVYLDSAERIMRDKGIETETVVVEGADAGNAILDYAGRHQIDQIALATHGRGGLGRALRGSVADYVLRESTLPVLVIRPKV